MGVERIAEGVEKADQLALLRTLGCGAVRGYLIGHTERLARDLHGQPLRKAA